MATLTTEEKAQRARQRMLEKAREYSTGSYIRRFVAPLFQKMVRAEFGAQPSGEVIAVLDGVLLYTVFRRIGECVCVTCGKVAAWDSGIKGIHTGHFLASRCNSILFQEENVAPQCASCNYYHCGAPLAFRLWMEHVRGAEVIQRLERLKTTTRSFTREELVDMKMAFQARLKAAEERMETP